MKSKVINLYTVLCLVSWGVKVKGFGLQLQTRRETRLFSSVLDKLQESLTKIPTKELPRRVEPMPWTQNTATYGKFDQADWGWCYTTVPDRACSSYECYEIEGAVPKDINGIYYKAGPGNFEREGRRYEHCLDGDGFVSAFDFKDGKVQYTGNFVETEFYLKEKEKDQILYRNVFGTQRKGGALKNAFDIKLKNVANTNVLAWGKRVFALWEAGRPYELDPNTLETLPFNKKVEPFRRLGRPDSVRGVSVDESGPVDKFMNLGPSFTSHPVYYNNETLVVFTGAQNVKTKNLNMEFFEYNQNWQKTNSVQYSVPDTATPPHDFAVSEKFYCFFQNQFDIDNIPFLLGFKAPTQAMLMALQRPNILHLVPRHSDQATTALHVEIPYYFTIHTTAIIAEENDQTITIYSNGWDLTDRRYFPKGHDHVPFLGSWGGPFPDFENGCIPPALLYRTVVDLQSGNLLSHQEVFPGLTMEFPKQDERESDTLYIATSTMDGSSLPGTGLAKVKAVTNEIKYWWADQKIFTGESLPIPKQNGEPGSWIMTILYDAKQRRATLGILDSERFEEGPVCRVHLPHHLAYALHGSFAQR